MARRGFRTMDWLLVMAFLALIGVGLALVHSAGQGPAVSGRSGIFARQLMWLGMGSMLFIVLAVIPFRFWEEYSHFLYGVAVILLLIVLVAGVERDGARRWLVVGGFQFQPSEMAKLATLLLVARLLARPRLDLRRPSQLLPVALVALLPFVLILMEPDLGTSLSLPAAVVPMFYWAGLPLGWILILVSPVLSVLLSWNLWIWLVFLGATAFLLVASRLRRTVIMGVLAVNIAVGAAAPILWNTLHPYQQQRVLTLLHPEMDPLGSGYQAHQSKVAIGSGGWTGKGYLEGTQKGLAFLPHTHTDFIFSILGEEFGFLGCAVVLLLYALLIQRGLLLASRARSRFAAVLAAGISCMILFHVVVNVSMTIGLVPVTGLPLPFLSYGGTFLLLTMAQCGLLVNVAVRRNEV